MNKNLRKELQESECKTGYPLLSKTERKKYLSVLNKGWKLKKSGTKISRKLHFKNYYETIAFVNALAWVANQQNHHPDLKVSYKQCKVAFSTHDANGITKNDLICAAKVDQLLT